MGLFSSVVLVDRRGRLLMQERDEHPVIDPECWGFPGGSVEDGEDYEAAAYRELAEETGVELPPGSLTPMGPWRFRNRHATGDDEFTLWVGGTDLTDVACHEGRQMTFVDPDEIGDRPLTVAAGIALPALLGSDLYDELNPARRTAAHAAEGGPR